MKMDGSGFWGEIDFVRMLPDIELGLGVFVNERMKKHVDMLAN
jgi:hypothetical protein